MTKGHCPLACWKFWGYTSMSEPYGEIQQGLDTWRCSNSCSYIQKIFHESPPELFIYWQRFRTRETSSQSHVLQDACFRCDLPVARVFFTLHFALLKPEPSQNPQMGLSGVPENHQEDNYPFPHSTSYLIFDVIWVFFWGRHLEDDSV